MNTNNEMKIRVNFTWYRSTYNYDSVSNFVILHAQKSKKAVTHAIRQYFKDWSGNGRAIVSSISTTFIDDNRFCQIKQSKFYWNNN